jgi:glycosyltransferase involved in cell wall biosynthesis
MIGVVYVATSAKIGGGNRVLMDLVTHIDRTRFTPVIAGPGDGPLLHWAEARGFPVGRLPGGNRPTSKRTELLRQAIQLALLVRRHRARIVHAMAHTCYRQAGLAGLLTGAARICHLGFPPGRGELEWVFGKIRPDAVIGCHESQAVEVAPAVRRVSPRIRLIGITNGVDTRAFSPPPGGVPDPGSPFRFGVKHVVLIVGHLSEVKGYPVFLEAAARTIVDVDDVAFVALGGETTSPGYRAFLERRASELGIRERLHFLGWRDDVAEVLRAADVMVLPSLDEGLPIAILEAMACGRPVVATPVGGVPEAVVDGQTGLLVPPGDAAALSDAMTRLLRDPALGRRLGDEGRRRAETVLSIERVASRVEALYEELLAR